MSEIVMEKATRTADGTTIKERMQDILLDISWRALARRYFGKSSSWIYHKMDGIYSGSNSGFTAQEQAELKGALYELADRIRRCADTL
ncbi:DUF5053 domain-containing protein [uncultured Porphyromonas sp.]|uniref:DUF5053 domain-containing protein n=1 Tax=uncultured Porphyromonas sp. TaxID=159274 RepID=UPI002627255A|nr:DUF5053 domain-containing protein [uncultured Porphyromonas sp.]